MYAITIQNEDQQGISYYYMIFKTPNRLVLEDIWKDVLYNDKFCSNQEQRKGLSDKEQILGQLQNH